MELSDQMSDISMVMVHWFHCQTEVLVYDPLTNINVVAITERSIQNACVALTRLAIFVGPKRI